MYEDKTGIAQSNRLAIWYRINVESQLQQPLPMLSDLALPEAIQKVMSDSKLPSAQLH